MSASDFDPAGPQSLQALRELAESAARVGGELARASFGQTQVVSLKADRSEVTEVDLAAERAIIAHIRHQRPNDAFIGEEAVGERHEGSDEATQRRSDEEESRISDFRLRTDKNEIPPNARNPQSPIPNPQSPIPDRQSPIPDPQSPIRNPQSICWVIDPLDGTRNYIRHLPIFTCAVAALRAGAPIAGAVYDPMQDVMYSAALGQGTHIDGRATSLADATSESACKANADLLVGIPSAQRRATRPFVLHAVERHVVRNLGSTALHMALVATGQLDVAVLGNSKLWDVAAGALIITEAGGIVTTPDGKPVFPLDLSRYAGEEIAALAGRPEAHARLMREVKRR